MRAGIIMALSALILLEGCKMDKVNLHGSLLFSSGGNDIQLLHLDTLERDEVYRNISNGIAHKFFTKYEPRKVIFGECVGLRKPNCILQLFDLQHNSMTALRTGVIPTYIAETETLFFYDYADESTTPWLMKASKNNLSKADKIIKFNQKEKGVFWFDFTYPVVQVSSNRVAFLGEKDKLQFYDLNKEEVIDTTLSGLIPLAWKENSRQLICMGKWTYDYHLLNIDTEEISDIPELDRAYGLVFIPSQNVILYGLARTKYLVYETSDTYILKFPERKKNMILEGHSMASGLWLSE